MRSRVPFAAALCAAAVLAAPARAQRIGVPQAPEIDAGRWFNVQGEAPTLTGLRGKVVLLEFWATWCAPCQRAWPHLKELHAIYAERGLAVLALSYELPEDVEAYLRTQPLPFPVAAGSGAQHAYKIQGYPTTVLIDAQGREVWRGHPKDLQPQRLERLLGAGRPPLALASAETFSGRAATAAQRAAGGELGAALAELAAIEADGASSEAERADARRLADALERHAAALVDQARASAKQKDYAAALRLLEALGRELERSPLGDAARAELARLEADEPARSELAARRALDEALDVLAKRGPHRARGLLEAVVTRYPGTQAADEARGLIKG